MINSEVLNKIYDLRYQIEAIRDFDKIEIAPTVLSKSTKIYLYYNFVKKRITNQFNFGECVRISNRVSGFLSKEEIKETITKFTKTGVGKASYSVNLEEEFAFRSMENGIIPPQLLPDEVVEARLKKHLLGLSSSSRGNQVPMFYYQISTEKYWRMIIQILTQNIEEFDYELWDSYHIIKLDRLLINVLLVLNNFVKSKELQTSENKKLLNDFVILAFRKLNLKDYNNYPQFYKHFGYDDKNKGTPTNFMKVCTNVKVEKNDVYSFIMNIKEEIKEDELLVNKNDLLNILIQKFNYYILKEKDN